MRSPLIQTQKRSREESPDSSAASPGAKRRLASPTFSSRPPLAAIDNVSDWPVRPGMIAEVRLKNFMCHQNLQYSPVSRLNFLCGENGSGKSAVLAGVVFALGGTVRDVNRGNATRNLIRQGQARAVVEVRLHNCGEDAYRPDVYGDEITIARTAGVSGGSPYVFKDSRGRCVKVRKPAEELKRITSALGIQVKNPVAVLNQDAAKSFLYRTQPERLYEFFMAATQLVDCMDEYNDASAQKGVLETVLKEKADQLEQLKGEIDVWNRKLQNHQNNNDRKNCIEKKKAELLWALVDKSQKSLSTCINYRQELEAKISNIDSRREKEKVKVEELKQEKSSVETKIQAFPREVEKEEVAVKEFQQEVQKCRSKEKGVKENLSRIRHEVRDKATGQKALAQTIAKLKSKDVSKAQDEKENRSAKIQELEGTINSRQKQKASLQAHSVNLVASIESGEAKLRSIKIKRDEASAKMAKREEAMQSLKKHKNNKHILLGERMPRLLDMIQTHQGKFQKVPIGPIAFEVDLAPTIQRGQAVIVEYVLQNLLTSFMVDNFDDRRVLDQLQRQCGTHYQVITTKFSASKYDVTKQRCSHPSYPAIYDLIIMKNASVHNCVVDQRRVEQILVIPTEVEARQVMSDRSNVPAQCHFSLTAESFYQYYPAPEYRSYSVPLRKDSTTKYLKASVDDRIGHLRDEMKDIKQQVSACDEDIRAAKEDMGGIRKEKHRHDELIRKLENEIKHLDVDLGNLKNEAETQAPTNLAALEEEYDREEEALAKAREDEENLKKELETLDAATKEAHGEYEEARAEYDNKVGRFNVLKEELEALERSIGDCNRVDDRLIEKRGTIVDELNMTKLKQDDHQAKYDKTVEGAKKKSPEPIESTKAPEDLHKEITDLEKIVERHEESKESLDEVLEKLDQMVSLQATVKESLKRERQNLNDLRGMHQKRKEGFNRIRDSISRMVKMFFLAQMNAKKFKGSLTFDHNKKTLDISVSPDGGDTRAIKTLSGGEKSCATISLILALWDAMHPPFRILDEFDVFMDMVNRKLALQSIISYAKQTRKFQYIFLTPLDIGNITVDEDVSITKLTKNKS